MRSVFLHMMGDAASSVAIVIAAALIPLTGWLWLDPAVSIGIAVWILVWAAGLMRESGRVLLEMAPEGMDVDRISTALREQFPPIRAVTHAHLWMIRQDVVHFSARLDVDGTRWPAAVALDRLNEVNAWLSEDFNISESTLQIHVLQ